MRYRSISPRLGRWLLRDPLHFIDGPNMVLVLLSNPTKSVDPYGLFGLVAGGEVFGPPSPIDLFTPPPYYKWPDGPLPNPCEEACQEVLSDQGPDSWLGGATTCNGFNSIPCVCILELESFEGYPPSGFLPPPPLPGGLADALDEATSILSSCTEVHEAEHAKKAKCYTGSDPNKWHYRAGDIPSPMGGYRDGPDNPDKFGSEAANAASEKCMKEKQAQSENCKSGSTCDMILDNIWHLGGKHE